MLNDEQILLKTTQLLENFDISTKKPEKLLREMDEVELEALAEILDGMKGEDLAFNKLFNGKMRKIIDFPVRNIGTELGKFANMLESIFNLDVEWEKGLVSAEREWDEHSLENDTAQIDQIMGAPDTVKRQKRKFSMKIGKYLAKIDQLLSQYKEMRLKVLHHGVDGRQTLHWVGRITGAHLKTALSEKEQKRYNQILNQLELYVGNTSAHGLRQFVMGITDKNEWTAKERARRDAQDEADYAHGKELRKRNPVIEAPDTKFVDLGNYWLNNAGYIKKEINKIDNDKYSIIITRHPIDVMRMSDFEKITSCHSPPSRSGGTNEYYKCAVAEAMGHGALAYVVKTEDLLYETNTSNIESAEQEIQKGEILDEVYAKDFEIFWDDGRPDSTSGVSLKPISRVRLRQMRYYDTDTPKRWDDGTELAVPEKHIYGEGIPGIADRVVKWADENQKEAIRDMPETDEMVNLDRFWIFGGSYEDTSGAPGRKRLLSALTGIDEMHFTGDIRQNRETEDALDANAISGLLGRYRAEVARIENDWNQRYATTGVSAEVHGDDEGGVYIEVEARITFTYALDEFSSLPNSSPTGMHAFDSINDWAGDIFVTKSGFVHKFSNTTVHVGCEFNLKHPEIGESALVYDPAGFDAFCAEISKLDKRRHGFKEEIDKFLKQEGYLEGGEYLKLAREIEDGDITAASYEWDVRYDGEYEESYEATASIKHDFNPEALGISPQILVQILDSNQWKVAIRRVLFASAQQAIGTEYHLDTNNSSAVPSGEDIEYIIEFRVTADDPDDRVKLFRELVTGEDSEMDDEDNLNAAFDSVMAQFINSRQPSHMQQSLDERLVRTWKGFLGR